jgi:hypothetical protein
VNVVESEKSDKKSEEIKAQISLKGVEIPCIVVSNAYRLEVLVEQKGMESSTRPQVAEEGLWEVAVRY